MPNGVLWAGALLCLASAFTSNPLLTVGCAVTLVTIFLLLWRPAEPPVLFYAMAYQWLQASILVLSADLQGLALDDVDHRLLSLHGRPTDLFLEPATWLTLAGLLAVSLGMRLAAGPSMGRASLDMLANATARISPHRAFVACIASMVVGSILVSYSYVLPGLSQPVLALGHLHWVAVYILAYVVLTQRRGYGVLALVLAIELGIGFLGFFSEFKTVLVVMLLAALSIPSALRGARLWMAGLIVVLMIVLGVIWSAIKVEYRGFLNQGTRDQVVLVSKSQQIAELGRLLGNLDEEQLARGASSLVKRLTYVYFFSETIQMVPKFIPHEEGALWGDALYRTFVPRLLDPDKSSVDDSERTAQYTGLFIIGGDSGTSISLGYVGESYVDFGPVFMMIPLFLWGALVGYVFRTFTRNRSQLLVGYGSVSVIVLMNASVLELSNAKMIAGLVLSWVVMYLAQKYGSASFMHYLRPPSLRPDPRAPRGAGVR